MWEPDPGWAALAGPRGAFTAGLWSASREGRDWVVKRVERPDPIDLPEQFDPTHPAYWRREAEVALSSPVLRGLVAPEVLAVEEDDDGYTLWTQRLEHEPPGALFAARALGSLPRSELLDHPWLAEDLLGKRLARAEQREGWPTLARTTVADLADLLWRRRGSFLARYRELPLVPTHGDVTAANVVARRGDEAVAVDWGMLGRGPAGADLGYLALSSKEDFEVLLGTYLDALIAAGVPVDPEEVAFAARLMAVYTAVARAEWALAKAAPGPGALAGKYRHPSVAPYLRALQRQFPQIEVLVSA